MCSADTFSRVIGYSRDVSFGAEADASNDAAVRILSIETRTTFAA